MTNGNYLDTIWQEGQQPRPPLAPQPAGMLPPPWMQQQGPVGVPLSPMPPSDVSASPIRPDSEGMFTEPVSPSPELTTDQVFGAGRMSGATPPIKPGLNQMSALQDIIARGPTSEPGYKPTSNWERIAAIIAAGAEGYTHGAGAGIRTGVGLLRYPEEQAEKDWQRDIKAREAAIGLEDREKSQATLDMDRRAQEKEREENTRFREFQMQGGPEKQKLELEAADRKQKGEALTKAGYTPQEVAEFVATGSLRRLDPSNEAGLALEAARGNKDAGTALKTIYDERLKQLKATHDPNEWMRGMQTWQQGDIAVRGQIEGQLKQLQAEATDPSKQGGPAEMQARQRTIDNLQAQMNKIDSDVQYIQDELGKRIGVPSARPSTPAAPPPRPPNVPGHYVYKPN